MFIVPHSAGFLKDSDMMRIFEKERKKMNFQNELIDNIEVSSFFETINGIGDRVSEWASNGVKNIEGYFIKVMVMVSSICFGVLIVYLAFKWKIRTRNNKVRKEELELGSIRKLNEENVKIYDVLDSE